MNDTLKRTLLGSLLAITVVVVVVGGLGWAMDAAFGYERSLSHGLSSWPFLELIFGGAVAGLASTRFHLTGLRQRIQRQESPAYRMLLSSLHGFLTGFIYGAIAGGVAGAIYIIGMSTHPQSTVASSAELVRYVILMGIGGAWFGGLIGGIANSLWQALSVPFARLKPLRAKPLSN